MGQNNDQRYDRLNLADGLKCPDGGQANVLVGVHDGLYQRLDGVDGADATQGGGRGPASVLVWIRHQTPVNGFGGGGPNVGVGIFQGGDQRLDYPPPAPGS